MNKRLILLLCCTLMLAALAIGIAAQEDGETSFCTDGTWYCPDPNNPAREEWNWSAGWYLWMFREGRIDWLPAWCGAALVDSDGDGVYDNSDACPADPDKSVDGGQCGCGVPDIDSEGDGPDGGPNGEGVISDGVADCVDMCIGDDIIYGDTDGDGYCDEMDVCMYIPAPPPSPNGCPTGIICWNVGDLCYEDTHCMEMASVTPDGNGPGCNSRGLARGATGCGLVTPPPPPCG